MQPWKINQSIYHRTTVPDDYLTTNHKFVVDTPSIRELTDGVISYFIKEDECLRYPYKSYAVAIVYSLLLNRYFGADITETLSDANLLYDNDAYFVPYGELTRYVYDQALTHLLAAGLINVEANQLNQVKKTVSCFYDEFMVDASRREHP